MLVSLPCFVLSLIYVPTTEALKSLSKNVPVLKQPIQYSADQWKKVLESQKPDIDGAPQGNKKASEDAGRINNVKQMIIGGTVSKRGEFPWKACILIDEEYYCGGSLITRNHVLTAAHCTDPYSKFSIILGAQNKKIFEDGRVTIDTSTKFVHPNWTDDTLRNDISILELPAGIQSTKFMRTVRLPTKKHAKLTFADTDMVISGWGRTSDASDIVSDVSYDVQLKIMSNADCLQSYGTEYVKSTNICASGTDLKGTCNGDSGGPLVYKDSDGSFIQMGVVSYGSAQGCEKGLPSVFTRVSSYLKWISSKTGLLIN